MLTGNLEFHKRSFFTLAHHCSSADRNDGFWDSPRTFPPSIEVFSFRFAREVDARLGWTGPVLTDLKPMR